MTLLTHILSASVALSSAAVAYASPSSKSLEQSFGKPSVYHEYQGVGFRVFNAPGLKIVAVNPPNSDTPSFLSFTKESGQLAAAEVNQFLSNFSASTGSSWKILDRSLIDHSLQFFMSAPYANPKAAQEMLNTLANPAAASSAWERLARDPQSRVEASKFIDMLRAQRQLWVTDDGRFLAAWSADGSSLGVGIVPPSAR